MPPEQSQQGRRPHYHRGRRGSDRRGPDRRNVAGPSQPEQGGRDQQDVEQIMREIRARISQRHGIELTTQQIQELAARRLEAILDPRTVNPSLLEQLRRSAGQVPEAKAADATPAYVFEDRTIYESHNGFLRFIRRILNPILKLFFNPNPIAHALNAQAKLNAEFAVREAERDRRQAEWNALHYDVLQRLVTETARVSIEMQSLSSRVEALGARVDFSDRRVRIIEAGAQSPRPAQRQPEPRGAPPAPVAAGGTAPEQATAAAGEARPADGAPGEAGRRRRRRRRGRRSGAAPGEAAGSATDAQLAESDLEGGEGADFDEAGEEEITAGSEPGSMDGAAEPPRATSSGEMPPASTAAAPAVAPAADRAPAAGPDPAAQEPSSERPTAAAAPPPFPQDDEGAATTPPSLPRDEPDPAPEPKPEAEPLDR